MLTAPDGQTPDGQAPAGQTVVLGVGNILYGDEGVGVYGAQVLADCFRFAPTVDVIDGAMLGPAMLEVFSQAKTLIVLDALAADAEPGSIFRLPAGELRELRPGFRPAAHEVDPLHLLRMAPLLGHVPDMVLLGIVPASTQIGVGLSPALEAAFPRFIGAALHELRSAGICVLPVAPVELQDAVGSLVGRRP